MWYNMIVGEEMNVPHRDGAVPLTSGAYRLKYEKARNTWIMVAVGTAFTIVRKSAAR